MKSDSEYHYRRSLRKLPLYQPPDEIWKAIEEQLPSLKSWLPLDQLPVHEPPTEIWENMTAKLDRISRIKSFGPIFKYAAISIGILLASGWLFYNFQQAEKVRLSHGVEKLEPSLAEYVLDDDSKALSYLEEACNKAGSPCSEPEFLVMMEELEELTDAKSQITVVMSPFNESPALIDQLTRIELQRTTLLKQMIAKI